MIVLKTTFSKNKPRKIVYRNYKYFTSQNFNNELEFVFSKENIDSCSKFNQTFLNILNKHAPLKKKQLRANHASYVSKSMRKAIMRRSYLENVYFKKRREKSLRAYRKQKNYSSSLYKKERKKFFNKLNPYFVIDNKLFWKAIKPFFSNKESSGSNIKLVEKDEILQDDKKIAEELNNFFKNAVSTIDINENSSIINQNFDDPNFDDPVDRAIEIYKYHPSIILINQKIGNQNKFSSEPVALSDIVKEINDINLNKSSSKDSIPPKMLKISSEATANILQKLLNDSLETGMFPDSLKLADITPVLKKKDPLNKTNYHPVNVLPIVSKLFEKIMQNK